MSPRIPPHLGPVTPDSSTAPSFSAPTRPSIPPEPPRAPRHRRLPRWIGLGLGITALVVLLPILALRWLPPPTSAFMLQSPVKPVQYTWVPAARISDAARRAVLASEDQKFYDHAGFDLAAIQDAIEFNQRHDRTRGASTISQQTAKNLFLWPGGGYFRKGAEAGLTVLIELLWPKARIVEIYLNIAEFGPGIYGVEAAAQHYFGKPAAALTAPEAARLAAVLPNPRGYSVTAPGPHVLERSRWILQQMRYGAGVEPDGMQPPEGAEQNALPEADDAAPVPVEAPGDRWSLADTQAPKAGADIQTRRLQEPEALEAMPLDDGADDLPWTTEPLPSPASTDADT